MEGPSRPKDMSPGLLKVAERARREPAGKFHSLAHLIDTEALGRAYRRLRNGAAEGVDGISKEQYGQELDDKLQDLHRRLVTMEYRHQPMRRVKVPKEGGGQRPIGISTVEDKIVQLAIKEVLEAVYEQDFRECSYGFRPGRGAHDAMRKLNQAVQQGEGKCILEMDIVSFFDSVDRNQLMAMLRERVPDGSLLRLVGKCLHVGILEGQEYSEPDQGTAQGSGLSPLLGNIYLHHVLDRWFEDEVKPCLKGKALLIRYADDAVMGFEDPQDAERVRKVLGKRLERRGLKLHPDKTRLVPFGKPRAGQPQSKGSGTFDFLGFTIYWRKTRGGGWRMACKTRRARLRRAIGAIYDFCRRHRHKEVKEQHASLVRRIQGHFNYFGVNGNGANLSSLSYHAQRAWKKWLDRRSQGGSMTWQRFNNLMKDYPLPKPRIMVNIWGT
jgi:RNA-directed DNA polymerase